MPGKKSIQPWFENSGRKFYSINVLEYVSIAADRSENDHAVNIFKNSGIIHRRLRNQRRTERISDIWLT